MSIGMSLHIGVNALDPKCYPMDPPDMENFPNGWDGVLDGCHSDAEAMCAIAEEQGFEAKLLLTDKATVEEVKKEVSKAAKKLKDGDIFFLSFAGHGGQVPDLSGDETDDTSYADETWCLYDRHLIDDEQQVMYTEFKEGVRILIFSDSCHSGSATRSDTEELVLPKFRAMTRQMTDCCYLARKKCYDRIQRNLPRTTPDDVKASMLLLSACEDLEVAGDGSPNGKFTSAVLSVWNQGEFSGDYKKFHKEVAEELKRSFKADMEVHREALQRGETPEEPSEQHPQLGPDKQVADAFEGARPFSI